MPNAIICMRPRCHNLVLNLEDAHGLERFTYSAKRGTPRKQTLDDYLCDDCNAELNHWLGVDNKGQVIDAAAGPQAVIERYNRGLGQEGS
jgi:hypothetical protein